MSQRIPLETLARLPSFYAPSLSWNKDKVAFYWDKTGRIELYVLDLASKEVIQLSNGQVPRSPKSGIIWTRDDQNIIFGRDVEGNEQNDQYLLNIETKEVTQLTHDPETSEYAVELSPDDEWLLLATNRFGQMNLARMEMANTKRYEPLTTFNSPVFFGIWRRDGEAIVFNGNETADLINQDVYLLDLASRKSEILWRERKGSQDRVADWSPDGRYLAVTSNAAGIDRPGIFDLAHQEVTWLGESGVNEFAVSFSENGALLVCLRNQQAEIIPVIYDLEAGTSKQLQLPSGMAVDVAFVLDDRHLFLSMMTPTSRQEFMLYDLETDKYHVVLEAEYGSIDPAHFVASEHIFYPSFDEKLIPALIHIPPDIPPGEKRAAVVIVHGGPTGQFFQSFDPYAQFLVDQGYVVLKPNIRGSTGYGVEFRDSNIHDLGGGDLEDVAAAADYLKSLPFVDGERLGIFGGSYGGYMTYMALTKKPDLWKAGSAAVGITDWKLLYEDSMAHYQWYLKRLLGDPDEHQQLLADRSPINFAHQLKAKLQIIHGVNDPRCPINQAATFRDRLLALGYKEGEDFEYHELGAQGHGSADMEQKLVWYQLLGQFLAQNL